MTTHAVADQDKSVQPRNKGTRSLIFVSFCFLGCQFARQASKETMGRPLCRIRTLLIDDSRIYHMRTPSSQAKSDFQNLPSEVFLRVLCGLAFKLTENLCGSFQRQGFRAHIRAHSRLFQAAANDLFGIPSL
jgi:hypothetical protein